MDNEIMLSRGPGGRLGTESLAHCFVGFDVRPADQIDAVGYRSKDAVYDLLAVRVFQPFQGFANGLRLTGEIDDQRLAANYADLARQNCRGDEMQTDLSHLLPETGH